MQGPDSRIQIRQCEQKNDITLLVQWLPCQRSGQVQTHSIHYYHAGRSVAYRGKLFWTAINAAATRLRARDYKKQPCAHDLNLTLVVYGHGVWDVASPSMWWTPHPVSTFSVWRERPLQLGFFSFLFETCNIFLRLLIKIDHIKGACPTGFLCLLTEHQKNTDLHWFTFFSHFSATRRQENTFQQLRASY